MNCDQARARISEYSLGTLPAKARATVQAHLAGCDGCREVLRALRVLDRSIAGESVVAGDELTKAVLERVIAEDIAAPSPWAAAVDMVLPAALMVGLGAGLIPWVLAGLPSATHALNQAATSQVSNPQLGQIGGAVVVCAIAIGGAAWLAQRLVGTKAASYSAS